MNEILRIEVWEIHSPCSAGLQEERGACRRPRFARPAVTLHSPRSAGLFKSLPMLSLWDGYENN